MLQNATPLRNQRPDLLTSLMNMSLVLRLPRKMQFCRSSSNVPRLPSFWKCCKTLTFFSLLTRCAIPCACHAKRDLSAQKWSVHGVSCAFWLRNVLRATTAYTFSTSQLPKVVRTWGVLHMLTSKCASRHNGVHFFWHLNFQKWSKREVFLAFWLANVLRATAACNFSSLISPDVSVPAALASLLFDPPEPPEPQIIGKKHNGSRPFPTFSRTWIFFLRKLSLFDILSSSLLFSSLLWLFPSLLFICSYCRKFDF